MKIEAKTMLFLLVIVCLVGGASAWNYESQPVFEPQGEWRVTPLNNGGYVVEGDLPEFTAPDIIMPEPAPPQVFGFEGIDRQGNAQGYSSIPVDRILSIGAEAWPVYDAERENVVAIRYGTAIRYGDGRWGWSEREMHEVAAELIGLGWATGEAPARWTHPLDGALPVAVSEWF